MGGGGRGSRKQILEAEAGVDELTVASAKTALKTVVAAALEERRDAILYHGAAYAEASGNPGPYVVEAAVRQAVREGTEFFLNRKLFGGGEG